MIGNEIYSLATKLWGINRSITGDGVRQTLSILKEICPSLNIFEVYSGTKVFDWVIPKEWKVRDAYITSPSGKRICQFKENNLHLVGYSIPINKASFNLDELNRHLYSLPDQPDAIPYVTSYYAERWGFCLSHNQRETLEQGLYEVFIDSELFDGSLTYGELIIKGATKEEVLISTYICHPSMANNELSGPTIVAYLAQWLSTLNRKYTYRIVFIPETIGSITYLAKNIDLLKKHVIAGFNVTCVGDNRAYSYLPSRKGDTLSDAVAKHILKWIDSSYKTYAWTDRGSDERQYCAPGIDLPIASIMRTKYGQYPEYHTSLDDLTNVVTPEGLEGGYNALKLAIEAIEKNCYPKVTVYGEPQLGKRGLYPTISTKTSANEVRLMMDLITWSDGGYSLLDIADKCGVPIWDLYPIVDKLVTHDLLDI